jgi:ubiquinone/menaquinone biosynthesis C-methylase UbiE
MDSDEYYRTRYCQVVGDGAVGFVSRWSHKCLERMVKQTEAQNVLELGAGNGQHLSFVKHSFNTYFETDIRVDNLPKRNGSHDANTPFDSKRNQKSVVQQKVDAANLSCFTDNFFDRVLAMCVIAHVEAPGAALEEWRRVTKTGGEITFYVPCEPGALLRITRYFTTRRSAIKMGIINPLEILYSDHRNCYLNLYFLIKRIFEEDQIEIKTFPVRGLSWNFAWFKMVRIKVNK